MLAGRLSSPSPEQAQLEFDRIEGFCTNARVFCERAGEQIRVAGKAEDLEWLRRAAAVKVEQEIESATAAYYASLREEERAEDDAVARSLSAAARRGPTRSRWT